MKHAIENYHLIFFLNSIKSTKNFFLYFLQNSIVDPAFSTETGYGSFFFEGGLTKNYFFVQHLCERAESAAVGQRFRQESLLIRYVYR